MAIALKIKTFLISPKTIILVILMILIACSIGFFVPQAIDKSPSFFEAWQAKNIYTYRIVTRLQLHRVYTSYWFLTLILLLLTSLVTSLHHQIKINLKHRMRRSDTEVATAEGTMQITRDDTQLLQIKKILHQHKYFDRGITNRDCTFSKNALGRWASVIFHSGLLLIIISALLVVCFQKRGFIQLIEGESFDGKESNLLVREKGLFAGEFDAGYETYLSSFNHAYWPNKKIKHLESHLNIINGNEAVHKKLSVNYPLLIRGTKIYQSLDYGYTLSFTLKKRDGEEIISNFNIDRAADVDKLATGTSDFPLSPYIFTMKFIPDLDKTTFYLNKPLVHLNIAEGLNTVFNGLVAPGNAIALNDGILQFTGVRYWSGLIFLKNPGIALAYIGFGVIVVGISTMFLLPYKEVHVHVADISDDRDFAQKYTVKGRTGRYQALFQEEMAEIESELQSIRNE